MKLTKTGVEKIKLRGVKETEETEENYMWFDEINEQLGITQKSIDNLSSCLYSIDKTIVSTNVQDHSKYLLNFISIAKQHLSSDHVTWFSMYEKKLFEIVEKINSKM